MSADITNYLMVPMEGGVVLMETVEDVAQDRCIRLTVQADDGTTAAVILEPDEAISLGIDLLALARDCRDFNDAWAGNGVKP